MHNDDVNAKIWNEKIADLRNQNIQIEVMWECEFRSILPSITNVRTSDIEFILQARQNRSQLLDGIESGAIFGFLICDLEATDKTEEMFANFPPIVQRHTFTKKDLTPQMERLIEDTYGKSLEGFSRETLVQKFNAKGKI